MKVDINGGILVVLGYQMGPWEDLSKGLGHDNRTASG